MSLAETTDAVRAKVGENSGLGAVLKFDLGADGVILVDAAQVPNVVSNTDGPADCTIGLSLANLSGLLNGSLNPTTAFMMGKLKVDGDMSVAMRLSQVI